MQTDAGLLLSFEYRLTRSPAPAIREALAAAERVAPGRPVTIVLQHSGVPTVALSFEVNGDRSADAEPQGHAASAYRLVSTSTEVASLWRKLHSENAADAAPPLLDLTVGPRYAVRWGFRQDPVQLQVNAAPRARVRLWQGMEVSAEVLLPLWNELGGEGAYVRPGIVTASQLVRLPAASFARFTIGTFTNRRYGADLRMRTYAGTEKVIVGFDAGRTASLYYPNGSIFFEADWQYNLSAYFAGFIPRYFVTASAAAGEFLHGERGVRLALLRQFGSVDVSFFAARTQRGRNGGFMVVIPLGGGLFWGGPHVRVRPVPDLTWHYDYAGQTDVAPSYSTGYSLDGMMRQHRPLFLRRSIDNH